MRGEQQEDLVSLLERRATEHGDRPLFSFLDRSGSVAETLSYRALFERAVVVAIELQRLHVQREPVALLYPQSSHFIVAFFGAVLAGAYPMPIAKPRRGDWQSVREIFRASGARALLTVRARGEHIPVEIVGLAESRTIYTDEIGLESASRWYRPDVRPTDIAFIQYTSGSTSKPKGVTVSHRNILHNSHRIRGNFANTSNDVGVSWLPFFHDMGLIGHIVQPLFTCIHNYFISPLSFVAQPIRWMQAISRFRGTISGGPNFAYELCCNKITSEEMASLDLSSWRIAYCGAEKIAPSTVRRFFDMFASVGLDSSAFHPCYGMAESTLLICGRGGLRMHIGSEGRAGYVSVGILEKDTNAPKDIDIQIVDPDTLTPISTDGTIGEVWVKSDSVASGYFGDAESTARAFNQTLNGVHGYLRTGDLGFVDNGDVFFVGRLKNLIKVRGSNYYAEDIEEHVNERFFAAGVRKCVAVSVEQGVTESVVILIECDDSLQTPAREVLKRSIHGDVTQTIGLVPHSIVVTKPNSLPVTTSGKPQRGICRERFVSGMYS